MNNDQSQAITNNDVSNLSDKDLLSLLEELNATYRAGNELVSDHVYDNLVLAELQKRDPENDYLNSVEPETEGEFTGKTVTLSQRMLSTDKAYSPEAVNVWAQRIKAAAEDAGINNIIIQATPKLDGFAALDNGESLVTRGNGYKGTDISHVFDRGVTIVGDRRGQGAGEIVISKSYFEEFLINHFDNSRNFQATITKEKVHDDADLNSEDLDKQLLVNKAIADGASVFYPFSELPRWEGTLEEAVENLESIIDDLWTTVDYDVDGVVFEAPALREQMGHTSHHHRNTIAFKRNEDPVDVEVKSITFQTGKTGKITPVAELVPTRISGAVLSRATLHNMGWAEKNEIGPGAIVGVVRSGLVIPKVVHTTTPAKILAPSCCPSCDSGTDRDGDNLICSNETDCPAQVGSRMEYFFKTLGNCDGLGPKAIDKLLEGGVNSVPKIYSLTKSDLMTVGFGEKTAANLLNELQRSIETKVEDWRFLAAFSLHQIGKGGCEKLLKEYPLKEIFDLDTNDIIKIDGFADKTAGILVNALDNIKDEFAFLSKLDFNLTPSELTRDMEELDNPIAGKTIVFTGSMQFGSRGDMTKQAKAMGAKVSSSVSKKTSILVIGANVGATKINAAKANDTQIMVEQDYFELLEGESLSPR